MTDDNNLTLERLNLEVEKIGSLMRSLSIQVAGIRTRVTDLELWGPEGVQKRNSTGFIAAGKNKKRPSKGKNGKGKRGKQSIKGRGNWAP
jgi:hypothetical protein